MSASMTFGRPARLQVPRGSLWFASGAALLIEGLRRLDRGQLGAAKAEPQTVARELREPSLWTRTVTRAAPGQDDPACESIRYAIATALTAAQIRPPHAYRVVRQALERTTTRDEAP